MIPSEVLTMILLHTLPERAGLAEETWLLVRTQQLKELLVVSKQFAHCVLPLLYSHVLLPRPSSAWAYAHRSAGLAPSSRKPCSAWTDATTAIRLGTFTPDTPPATASADSFKQDGHRWSPWDLLLVAPSLTHLTIVQHFTPIDPTILSWAQNLQQLTIDSSPFAIPRPASHAFDELWHLPHLQTLILDTPRLAYRPSTAHPHGVPLPLSVLLTPLCLPALTTLGLIYPFPHPAPEFPLLAPQLVNLFLARRPGYLPPPHTAQQQQQHHFPSLPIDSLKHCFGIHHLFLDIHTPLDLPLVLSIPGVLESLKIETFYVREVERELLASLAGQKEGPLDCLEKLWLPQPTSGQAEAREDTRSVLAERGIKLARWRGIEGDTAEASDVLEWLDSTSSVPMGKGKEREKEREVRIERRKGEMEAASSLETERGRRERERFARPLQRATVTVLSGDEEDDEDEDEERERLVRSRRRDEVMDSEEFADEDSDFEEVVMGGPDLDDDQVDEIITTPP